MQTTLAPPETDSTFGVEEIIATVPASLSQVAEWLGITRRQLSYWIKQGLLPFDDRITLETLERAALIKSELDRKLTLKRATARIVAAVDNADEMLRLEDSAPIDDLAKLFQERIDSCVGLASSLRQSIGSLDRDELEDLAQAIARVRLMLAKNDSVLPRGFSIVLDQLVEACDTLVLSAPERIR
jgi:DNA-binding transcriptional MerR regulator